MDTATIDIRALAAVSVFASTEETRYFLNGVCLEVEPRAVTYVATDGHRLIVHRVEKIGDTPDNDLTDSFIIPTAQCRAHKLTKKETETDAVLSGDSKRLTITFRTVDITFSPIDGSFPDWRHVAPASACSGNVAQFNYLYAADFERFGAALGLGRPFLAHNGADPAYVWFGPHRDTFGVLMPIRSDELLARTKPDWAAAQKLAEAA